MPGRGYMEKKIVKIWFSDDRLYGITEDGRELWQSLLYYKRLLHATPAQRERYTINAFGIRWEELDEDVSFESFFYPEPEPQGMARFFFLHPELNVSAVARQTGIEKSLFAQYLNGTKKTSEKRKSEILVGKANRDENHEHGSHAGIIQPFHLDVEDDAVDNDLTDGEKHEHQSPYIAVAEDDA